MTMSDRAVDPHYFLRIRIQPFFSMQIRQTIFFYKLTNEEFKITKS